MKQAIGNIRTKKILVIGDLMLDVYMHGKTQRISPEAPVPVVSVERKSMAPGGAANVMVNLQALGCFVTGAGFIGDDDEGRYLHHLLTEKYGVNTESIVLSQLRTIHKNRILANGQHIIRYDYDTDFSQSDKREELLGYIEDLACSRRTFHAVVISDYCKGTICADVMSLVKKVFHCPIICDTKPNHRDLFTNVWCITPNLMEAREMVGYSATEKEPAVVARDLKRQMNLNCIIVTLSDKGILLIDENDKEVLFKAYTEFDEHDPNQRFDVTGAGDTVVSVFAACLAAGFKSREAVLAANIAAGVVVKKIGTSACSYEELMRELDKK